MPTEIEFNTPDAALRLYRYPVHKNEQLRAWDAADEYVLSHLAENPISQQAKNILVVNDSFGALSLGLRRMPAFADAEITIVSDSAISHSAIQLNAVGNGVEMQGIQLLNSFEFANLESGLPYDLVVIKIPKSLAQLEDNLRRIASKLGADTRVIGAGMVKNVHNSTLALFEECIGETNSSLAKKKARLIFSTPRITADNSTAGAGANLVPEPATQFRVSADSCQTPEDLVFASYPGVFCHGSLDYGTRFMLESMEIPELTHEKSSFDILDLGCGTGALGIVVAKRLNALENEIKLSLTFVDESFAAIESVKESIKLSLPEVSTEQYQALAIHCLEGIADESRDLILNNPPFHDAAARTSTVALEMFRESKRVLRVGGQLQVVANRHLGYHKALKDIFGNCKTMASNAKFVVLGCIKNARSGTHSGT